MLRRLLSIPLDMVARLPKFSEPKVHPSLESFPIESHPRRVYREDVYENGAYVDLPDGRVRFWLMGPESGPKVVLIHGLAVPSIVWKDVAVNLISKGYRLLVYDLYGQGYSAAPSVPYNAALYTSQLALLLQYVGWDKSHIVGLSMGGGIAAAFVAQFPKLCSGKVVLLAPAGICRDDDLTMGSRLISTPLATWIVTNKLFRGYMQRQLSNNTKEPKIEDIVGLQFAYLPGFAFAFASSLRVGPLRGQHAALKKLASSGLDVLLIHGTADDTIPYKCALEMHSLMPQNSKVITIDQGLHLLPVSHPNEISSALLDFFGERS